MDWFLNNPIIADLSTLAVPALFNIYFAAASIPIGFALAIGLTLMRASSRKWVSSLASIYIYAFRGSPLFIQLFMFYTVMLSFNLSTWKPLGIDWLVLHPLFLGPAILVLNTGAYSAEIFYGAYRNVPKGELDAARAYGMSYSQRFRSIIWPHMMRLAWPAYTNEVVFLFHATALIYFTLPVINEQKDLMNKAGELFERDFNAFVHYPAAALFFLGISFCIYLVFGQVYRAMTRHLRSSVAPMRFRPRYMR